MPVLEFWFDYSCPYAWLASRRVEALAARTGATLRWRPMLLGGVFRARDTPQNLAGAMPAPKARYLFMDQARLAHLAGEPLDHPPEHPRRTVAALRATLARGCDPAVIHAFFRAYWAERRPVEDLAVVRAIAGEVDLDAQRDALRDATDEAIALGVFGAPTYVIRGDDGEPAGLWWGGDREDLVEQALTGALPPRPVRPALPGASFEVWFDYSSPFAYLGVLRADALARRTGARLVPRPMLLGGLFRAVGQADVPLFTFSEARRAWVGRDLDEQARAIGAPFRFNPHFPIRTVLPLRLTCAHPDPLRFALAVFDATWARGEDPNDLAVLRRCGAAEGLPPGVADTDEHLLALAAEHKNVLHAAADEALDAGLFGAPSFRVTTPAGGPWTFWGQDRVDQVEAALTGWIPPV